MFSRKIKLAFIMEGNLGSLLIRTNFVKSVINCFARKDIEVYFYGHHKEEINRVLFGDLDFIDYIGKRNEFDPKSYEHFDLVIQCETFPKLLYYKKSRIFESPKLRTIVEKWLQFYETHQHWLNNLPSYRQNIYRIAINTGKNCISVMDINNALKMSNDFVYSVSSNKNDNEILKRLNIKEPFITLNRGSFTIANQSEGTRVWPLSNYDKLVKLLKANYPQYQIVQLSESLDCARIAGINLDLRGQTSLTDLKTILYKSFLHIDGEGGMVHLRKALNGGPSVVIFGSTFPEYFGYIGNINISEMPCAAGKCVELHPQWLQKCLLSPNKPLCLSVLTPEIVYNKIQEYLSNPGFIDDKNDVYRVTKQMITCPDFKLDETWVKDWLQYQIIFSYQFEEIMLKDLRYFHAYGEDQSEIEFLEKSPAIKFLNGDKQAYNTWNEKKNKVTNDNIHNQQHFTNLIKNLDEGYDPRYPIVISAQNTIFDGFHRASYLYHKYGADYKIKVLKIYGFWQDPKLLDSRIKED